MVRRGAFFILMAGLILGYLPADAQVAPGKISDSVTKWRSQRDFEYMHSIDSLLRDGAGKTASARQKDKEKAKSSGFLNALLSMRYVKILLNVLAVLFISFILYKIIGSIGFFRNTKTKKTKTDADIVETESAEDLESHISEAEKQENYPLAIRYYFLYLLKLMKQKNLIDFGAEKTNADYLREVAKREFFNEFREATRYFEYIWYGKVKTDVDTYAGVKKSFYQLHQQIRNRY